MTDNTAPATGERPLAIYDLRRVFFSQAEESRFPVVSLNTLFTGLTVLYSNQLLRRLLKRIYRAAIAIEGKFLQEVFPKAAVLIGKLFCQLKKPAECNWDALVESTENVYTALLEYQEFKVSYIQNDFSEFMNTLLCVVEKATAVPFCKQLSVDQESFEGELALSSISAMPLRIRQTSLIGAEFEGYYETNLACPKCKYEAMNEHSFKTLSIDPFTDDLRDDLKKNKEALEKTRNVKNRQKRSFFDDLFSGSLKASVEDLLFQHFFGTKSKLNQPVNCPNCTKTTLISSTNTVKQLPVQLSFGIGQKPSKGHEVAFNCLSEVNLEWIFNINSHKYEMIEPAKRPNELEISDPKKAGNMLNYSYSSNGGNNRKEFERNTRYSLTCAVLESEKEGREVWIRKSENWMKVVAGRSIESVTATDPFGKPGVKLLHVVYSLVPLLNEKTAKFAETLQIKPVELKEGTKTIPLPIPFLYRFLYRNMEFKTNFQAILCEHAMLLPHLQDFKEDRSVRRSVLPEAIPSALISDSVGEVKRAIHVSDGSATALVYNSLSANVPTESFLKMLYKENMIDEWFAKFPNANFSKTCKKCLRQFKTQSLVFFVQKAVLLNLLKKKTQDRQYLVEKDWFLSLLRYFNLSIDEIEPRNWHLLVPKPANSNMARKLEEFRDLYKSDTEIVHRWFVPIDNGFAQFVCRAFGAESILRVSSGSIFIEGIGDAASIGGLSEAEADLVELLLDETKVSKITRDGNMESLLIFNSKLTTLFELTSAEAIRVFGIENEKTSTNELLLMRKLCTLKGNDEFGLFDKGPAKALLELINKKMNASAVNRPGANILKKDDCSDEESEPVGNSADSKRGSQKVGDDSLNFSDIDPIETSLKDIQRCSDVINVKKFTNGNMVPNSGKSRFANGALGIQKTASENLPRESIGFPKLAASFLKESRVSETNTKPSEQQHKTSQFQTQENRESLDHSERLENMIDSVLQRCQENAIEQQKLSNSMITGPVSNQPDNNQPQPQLLPQPRKSIVVETKKSMFSKPEINHLNDSLLESKRTVQHQTASTPVKPGIKELSLQDEDSEEINSPRITTLQEQARRNSNQLIRNGSMQMRDRFWRSEVVKAETGDNQNCFLIIDKIQRQIHISPINLAKSSSNRSSEQSENAPPIVPCEQTTGPSQRTSVELLSSRLLKEVENKALKELSNSKLSNVSHSDKDN